MARRLPAAWRAAFRFLLLAALGSLGSPVLADEDGLPSGSDLELPSIFATWTNLPPVEDTVARQNAPPPMEREHRALLAQAAQLTKGGDHAGAVRLYHEVLEVYPERREVLFGLSTSLIQLGAYGEAIAILEPLVERFPDDYSMKNNLAWVYATAEDSSFRNGERAAELAQEALLDAPEDYHVWSTLAEAHYICRYYGRGFRAAVQAYRLAKEQKAGEDYIKMYAEQIERCKRAYQAMSVAE